MTRNRQTGSELYRSAGIYDVARFYDERFVTGGVFDAKYFDSINRFDINFARTMWVYDNVRPSSRVLDLGCGEGVLALLKLKDVHLTGVDLSSHLVQAAHANGYDETVVSDLTSLPFASQSFDYVVSLDVMGHIAAEQKTAVLSEIKRVMRPAGVTMHGIEVLNRELHGDYEAMSAEELARFIQIDGHIGLEDERQSTARFESMFRFVEAESRYTLCLSCAEFIKQYDEYGVPFDEDFIDYLRGLSFTERKAFDMAMGHVFGRISDLHIRLPNSGLYLLLKASDEPLGQFYNEHRDRRALCLGTRNGDEARPICLDRSPSALFDNGWYAANNLPPVARWMGSGGRIRFQCSALSRLQFDVTTHIPELRTKPLTVMVLCNGKVIFSFSLFDYGWLEVAGDLPERLTNDRTLFELEFRCDRTWQPSRANINSTDDRHLSIAVCNIVVTP